MQKDLQYDILGISETWLDNSVPDTDIEMPGYFTPYRKDTSRHQKEILVHLSMEISAHHRPDLDQAESDIICVELQVGRKKSLVCNCYC